MKSKPELKGVPVLLLSGAFEAVDEAQLASSGANGVMEKPVEPTEVISRVKELLGLKWEAKESVPAGRLVTPATVPGDRPAPFPTTPRAVTSTRPKPPARDQLKDPRLDPTGRPAEAATTGDDYLDSLGDAFDTLDQRLAGRNVQSQPGTSQPRNPAPPLGQPSSAPVDPRSPGRMPAPQAATPSGPNPVYQVDDAWFYGQSKERETARTNQREMLEDFRAPELQPETPAQAAPPSASPVYEVDDEWFAEDRKAREARELEQRELAREMGIHEVELPDPKPAAVVSDDFEFGEADLTAAIAPPPASRFRRRPSRRLRSGTDPRPPSLRQQQRSLGGSTGFSRLNRSSRSKQRVKQSRPPVPTIVEVALAARDARPVPSR